MKNKYKFRIHSFLLCCFLIFFLSSCGVLKHIPEGSYYLKKNKGDINNDNVSSSEVKGLEYMNLAEQRPNSKFLWTIKAGMRIYCLSNPESESFTNRMLRKYGQAPVVFSEADAEETVEKMKLYLETKGIYDSEVKYIKKATGRKKRKYTLTYYIEPSKRYSISEITYTAEDDTIQKLVNRWRANNSVLQVNTYYNQDLLTNERDRIATMLTNNGYFGFNKDYIVFNIDTNLGVYKMKIELKVLNPTLRLQSLDSVVHTKHLQYIIGNVFVDPNANTLQQKKKATETFDTTKISIENPNGNTVNYYFLNSENEFSKINPTTIARYTFLYPGKMYRLRDGDRTYTGLSGISAFRYVSINFSIDSSSLSTVPKVDAQIRLNRNKVNNISTSLEVSNTSASNISGTNVGSFGFEWNIGYENRNLFGNAEVFNTKFKLAIQLSKKDPSIEGFRSYFNMFEAGFGVGLEIPKFLIPFQTMFFGRSIQPRTSFNVGYDYQYETDYERSIPNGGFGYKWKKNLRNDQALFPFELNAVRILINDSTFQESINQADQRIKYQYTNHLIFDARYSYSNTTQRNSRATHYAIFIMNLESAGNLFYLYNNIANSKRDENGIYNILGVPYSQYIRGDFDFRQYLSLPRRSSLVMRAYAGVGITYANSTAMPYEKSFLGGGANNIRAWRLRALGPGAYNESTVFDRSGDFSLCLNGEVRFPIFSPFEGAVFVDAGNIWLMRSSSEFPNGEFDFKTFYKEIGIGFGLGIRLNTPYVVLRLDAGMRVRDPAREAGDYWLIDNMQWKDLKAIVYNFGIGFPF